MNNILLKDILIIFLVSIPVVLLMRKGHFPVIIGFLVTGAIIGQGGLGIISDTEHINILAELGLAMLLFSVGLEFSLEHFNEIRNRALIAAFLQILLTFGAGYLIGWGLDWPFSRSLYFGCVLSLSSSAVVMTVLFARRMVDSLPGQLATTILIIQDLAFIPMIILLPLISMTGTEAGGLEQQLTEKAIALGVLGGIFLVGRLFIGPLLRVVSTLGRREIFVITVILLGMGASWLTDMLDLSFALGAFVAGLLIGFTDFKYQAQTEITPFRYCFNSLFFVSIGMLLNFGFIADNYLIILLLLAVIPVIKMLVIVLISLLLRLPLRIGIVTGLALAQIGEFSFLIVQEGYQEQVIGPYLHNLILASAVFSMMIAPFMIYYAPQLASWVDRMLYKIRKKSPLPKKEAKKNSLKLKDHVIICGFGPLGKTLAKLLHSHKIPYMVLELNPKTIEQARKEDIAALYGDGTSEEILYKSGIEEAKILAITVPFFLDNIAILKQAKEINPDIQIITRAKYRTDVEKLYMAGSSVVISEELEGGIEMGRYVLKMVGLPGNEVEQLMCSIREYGSADFFN